MSRGLGLADGRSVTPIATTQKKWADCFPGSAMDPTKWEISYQSPGSAMTIGVASSTLSVTMGTQANDELHLLSREVFTLPADLVAIFMLSQRIANNDVWVELVEVDPGALQSDPRSPIPDAGTDWANRASLRFTGTSATVMSLETTEDSSGSPLATNGVTSGGSGAMGEYWLEVRDFDTLLSAAAVDAASGRSGSPTRNSTQSPHCDRLYKARLRFKNGSSAPATSTTVSFRRIVVKSGDFLDVNIAGARGKTNLSDAIPVTIGTGVASIGTVQSQPSIGATSGPTLLTHKKLATADTNLTSVKTSAAALIGGSVKNTSAAVKYFKLYNKASAPVVASDVPIMTFGVAAGETLSLAAVLGQFGLKFGAGLAYAMTGAYADTDATALTAADMHVNLIYV